MAAKGCEILVSNVVRELAKGKDFQFVDRGEVALRGFDELVQLYEVKWQETWAPALTIITLILSYARNQRQLRGDTMFP